MTTPTFPLTYVGDGSSQKKQHRVLTAEFGDGYEQTVPDGINTEMEEWDIVFRDYPVTTIKTIQNFLDERASSYPFLWTPPHETEAKKWKQIGEYSINYAGSNVGTIRFQIKRVYTP